MNSDRRIALLAAAGVVGVVLASAAQTRPAHGASPRALGAPKTYLNLTLVPVVDKRILPSGQYLTLDEALKRKVLKVREASAGGEVNTLYITNYGDHPVYIIAGEVVLGGQQDRCLGKDMLIGAKQKNLPVPVFCVEHGRWTGSTDFGVSAKTVAAPEIRLSAQEGVFADKVARAPGTVARAGSVSSMGEAQGKVWDTVARKNRLMNAQTASGTYRGVLEQNVGDAGKRIGPYIKAFSGGLGADPHIVGVVALVDGKVVSADIFRDPGLFRKLWPKLLRSYAANAAETPKPKVSAAHASALAESFIASPAASSRIVRDRTQAGESQRVEDATRYFYLTAPTGGRGGVAADAAIHENILRK